MRGRWQAEGARLDAVIELKNSGDENATLEGAFNQLQTYKDDIPSLFRTNTALMTSDGLRARLGSLTANLERFMPWRTVGGGAVAPKGAPELETVIEGVFERDRFPTLIRDFTVFGDTGSGVVKIVAGYHQFHAVRRAVASALRALPGHAQAVRGDPARARMRVLVKRILRKHGYPPDLRDAAVRTVLQQAEILSARWAA